MAWPLDVPLSLVWVVATYKSLGDSWQVALGRALATAECDLQLGLLQEAAGLAHPRVGCGLSLSSTWGCI